MARGYIYHLTTDPDDLNSVTADDFETPELIGADFCETVENSENPARIAGLLASAGAVVTRVDANGEDETDDEVFAGWRVDAMSEAAMTEFRRRFFRNKFERLRALVGALTLDEFAADSPVLTRVESALNERFGDAVALGNGLGETFKTFDAAIRSLEPGTDYYLSRTCVLMH